MTLFLAFLAVAAAAALPFDRPLALWLKAREQHLAIRAFKAVTDWAKAEWWLAGLAAAYLAALAGPLLLPGAADGFGLLGQAALATLLGLLAGALALHTFKLFVGRTRPRDLFRSGAYGFSILAFDVKLDSFPSGHAQTIFGVMTALALMWPPGAAAFYAVAGALAASRAIVTAHYLSDVFVGSLIGAASAWAVVSFGFPHLIA